MIAYSRGSQRLAGTDSLSTRMPAVDRTSTHLSEIAQWVEQQIGKSVGSGFESRSPAIAALTQR